MKFLFLFIYTFPQVVNAQSIVQMTPICRDHLLGRQPIITRNYSWGRAPGVNQRTATVQYIGKNIEGINRFLTSWYDASVNMNGDRYLNIKYFSVGSGCSYSNKISVDLDFNVNWVSSGGFVTSGFVGKSTSYVQYPQHSYLLAASSGEYSYFVPPRVKIIKFSADSSDYNVMNLNWDNNLNTYSSRCGGNFSNGIDCGFPGYAPAMAIGKVESTIPICRWIIHYPYPASYICDSKIYNIVVYETDFISNSANNTYRAKSIGYTIFRPDGSGIVSGLIDTVDDSSLEQMKNPEVVWSKERNQFIITYQLVNNIQSYSFLAEVNSAGTVHILDRLKNALNAAWLEGRESQRFTTLLAKNNFLDHSSDGQDPSSIGLVLRWNVRSSNHDYNWINRYGRYQYFYQSWLDRIDNYLQYESISIPEQITTKYGNSGSPVVYSQLAHYDNQPVLGLIYQPLDYLNYNPSQNPSIAKLCFSTSPCYSRRNGELASSTSSDEQYTGAVYLSYYNNSCNEVKVTISNWGQF